eukprot:CAMPEP_0194200986 /NCGR_PEP_ID=MMETSP0156-20130528/1388_1 /TAXON_ID=33649 /ORGANISM="Thalassionema nitzschioides, Strain L26-B" /LENGTH=422 /DNA_ID=CAMNT_0038926071 /DNA_START=312 /DNA_END=1580 /DNA_ORIENTATION=-
MLFTLKSFKAKPVVHELSWAKMIRYVALMGIIFSPFLFGYIDHHRLSIDLGGGDCKWTESFPLPLDSEPFGTLVASYPGGGMRVTWQQIEGLTGIQVGDDYQFSGPRVGIIKTQWPHYEGIWSYGATLNQTILVVRNPRWAIPSFHNILSEVNYGQDFSEVYPYLNDLFTKRAPIANWIKWRDLKFEKEIELWAWHIDYYMEQGSKYWTDLDFDRVGEKPFHFLTDEEKPWPKDIHCINDIDCFPKALISYEKLRKHDTGPGELSKIANAVRDKKEMTVISDEAIGCVWFETFIHAAAPNNDDRDFAGDLAEAFRFTNDQLEAMANKLEFMKEKYSAAEWANVTVAQDLVSAIEAYISDVGEERAYMLANPSPTPPPNPDYHQSLVDWYAGVGGGNRYEKDKVRAMRGYWPLVKQLYNETER